MMEILYVGSLVGFVIVAILFKIHFTQKMGGLCRGTPFMVNVEHFLYIEQKCSIIFVGNLLDEIVMQCFWCIYLSVSCSCVVGVIHTDVEIFFFNFLYSHVEFYVFFLTLVTFYIRHEVLYNYVNFYFWWLEY